VELAIRAEGFKDMRVVVDGTETRQSIKLERVPSARPRPSKPPTTPTTKPTTKPPAGKRPTLGGGEIIDPWGK
jgi:hypothetical protein